MVEKYNLHHISTGALLRKEIAAGTELGTLAKSLIEKGCLVPDEVVEGMIENEFRNVTDVDGFLLDGFPRTLPQAEALDQILAKAGSEVTATVSIMIPDTMIMERIKGRALKEELTTPAKKSSTLASSHTTIRQSRSSSTIRSPANTMRSTVQEASKRWQTAYLM